MPGGGFLILILYTVYRLKQEDLVPVQVLFSQLFKTFHQRYVRLLLFSERLRQLVITNF